MITRTPLLRATKVYGQFLGRGFNPLAKLLLLRTSEPIGRQRVHFEAPPADRLEIEISRFLDWVNGAPSEPPLLKAGLGHLWFVTLHPFDDGNGRIARAIGDLLLTRADGSPQRFYSLSAQIQRERKAYYDILERTQKRSMDVTEWSPGSSIPFIAPSIRHNSRSTSC